MPITTDNLGFNKSERMIDDPDGGGRMTAVVIQSGVENEIFDDLSDVDRAAGDVSIRKVFAAVSSADADKYLDAGVVVMRRPADGAVSVLAFSTGDFYDERADAKDLLEQGISRGAAAPLYLWGVHSAQQRSILCWQYLSNEIPAQGARLDLAAYSGSVETHHQVLWVTRITTSEITLSDQLGEYTVRQLVLEISDPLGADYTGHDPERLSLAYSALAARIYATRYVPDAVALVGIRPLVDAVAVGDYVARVDSIYEALIPTALVETALADTTPGADYATLAEAGRTISWSTTADAIRPGAALYVGGPVYPGTLSISVSGSTITDAGGNLLLSGVKIGTMDYGNGVATWADNCPSYGTTGKLISYTPAAAPLRVADTAAQAVTVEGNGYVWTITLTPIPAPGSLRVAYRAADQWYVLYDDGSGTLSGADSSYGSGTINYASGTVIITTGALPDPDSLILYTWGVPISYAARGGEDVDPLQFEGTLSHPAVAPNTLTMTWTVDSTEYTVSDDGAGGLSGTGGTGWIRYNTGEWQLTPSVIPSQGAEIAIQYDYGDPVEESFAAPSRDGNGHIPIALSSVPRAGSVEVQWDLEMTGLDDQWDLETDMVPPTETPDLSVYLPPARQIPHLIGV